MLLTVADVLLREAWVLHIAEAWLHRRMNVEDTKKMDVHKIFV